MKKSRPGRIGVKVFAVLAILGLVAVPLMPTTALAADSLVSRGCANNTNTDNMLYNPSFEDVHNPSGVVYTVYSTPGGVNYWTTLNYHSQIQVLPEVNSLSTINGNSSWPVYDGYYEAALPSFVQTGGLTAGSQFLGRPGLVGTLSPRDLSGAATPTGMTTPGVTYVLSLRASNVAANDFGTTLPVAIEMRLRNSTTGAESAPIQGLIDNGYYTQTNHGNFGSNHHAWGLLSGTVTSNGTYDKVVIRHYQDTGWAFIDDVVVCRAPTPKPWWQNHGAQGGLALFVLGSAGMLFTWHTRRGKTGKKGKSSKASHVAVGDFDGDGKSKAFKVSENESPRPMNRVLRPGNQLSIGLTVIAVAGAAIFIASTAGGLWKSQIVSPNNTSNPTGKSSTPSKKSKTKTPTVTPATTKTCVDKETIKEGYKLFRSDKYKYCIQYPMGWPVDSTDPAKVTFGTISDGEPGPGWLKVTHFSDKTVATRDEEIKTIFKEPAGPCTETDTTLAGESGKKLDCIGAANGEHHIFYVVSEEGGNLFELSYIGGSATENEQYGIMVNSFLCDMFANKN